MARRLIGTALTLLVVAAASCSSSSTSSQPTTTSTTSKVAKLSSQTCNVLGAGLKQVESDVLAIGLAGAGAKGASSSVVSSSIASLKGLVPSLESSLDAVAPKSSVTSWGKAMASYADGLAKAASSGDASKVNEFNAQFQASPDGRAMTQQLTSIQAALAKACATSPAG